MKNKKSCNQCGQNMKGRFIYTNYVHIDNASTAFSFEVHVCVNPECPNYGLLQIPREELKENKI